MSPKPPNRSSQFLFTLLPFAVYIGARFIPLPTSTAVDTGSNHLIAVGIIPWIIAAVVIEIVSAFIPGLQRLRQQGEIGLADLRRVTNILGVAIAVLHAMWITFDLSYVPSAFIIDPLRESFPTQQISSPILAFTALMLGAITFKTLVDLSVPRSLLDNRGRFLAGALLLATIYTITQQPSPFARFDILVTDLIRIAVYLLQAGMLVAFLFLGPAFLWPNAPGFSISNRPTQST
ncbi:MAG TPA: hypothetical protein PK156_27455 [Polyangium sp.]|nr:hypothetical protein [Polyangium sp.]